MAHFTFRLATLLKMREGERDERRLRLAETRRAEDSLRLREETLRLQRDQLANQFREAAAPGPIDVNRLAELHRHEEFLALQQQQFEEALETLNAQIEHHRETLVAADREVRVLELLREKQSDRHRRETNRREIRTLDEMASTGDLQI